MSTTPSGSRLVSATTRRSQKGRACALSRWGPRIHPASRSRKRPASTSGSTSETSVSATLRWDAPGCSQGTLCAISTAVAAIRWRVRRRTASLFRNGVCAHTACAARACCTAVGGSTEAPARPDGALAVSLLLSSFIAIELIVHPAATSGGGFVHGSFDQRWGSIPLRLNL